MLLKVRKRDILPDLYKLMDSIVIVWLAKSKLSEVLTAVVTEKSAANVQKYTGLSNICL